MNIRIEEQPTIHDHHRLFATLSRSVNCYKPEVRSSEAVFELGQFKRLKWVTRRSEENRRIATKFRMLFGLWWNLVPARTRNNQLKADWNALLIISCFAQTFTYSSDLRANFGENSFIYYIKQFWNSLMFVMFKLKDSSWLTRNKIPC